MICVHRNLRGHRGIDGYIERLVGRPFMRMFTFFVDDVKGRDAVKMARKYIMFVFMSAVTFMLV